MPGRWLARAAWEGGDRIALITPDKILNYTQLRQRVDLLCTRLLQFPHASVLGVQARDPQLVVVALHAAARLGRVLLPLDLQMPDGQSRALLEQSGCHFVLGDAELPRLPKGITSCRVDSRWFDGDFVCQSAHLAVPAKTNDIVLIVPTTGTTSDPKGVMLSAANLRASVDQVNRNLDLHRNDCWLNCLPMSHIAGLAIPYRCARIGAAMVLHNRFDAEQVWRDLERHRVTHISLVPAMLGRLLDAAGGRNVPASLRVALIGGGALDAALAKRAHAAGWPLTVCYGMSETASMCTLDGSAGSGTIAGQVGRPMQGFRISLSEGSQGRIRISGAAVMTGYANPGLRPGDGLQDGWFESGDLGYWDDEGRLCVTGRADDLLNSGGLRLHPREVELLLANCPGLTRVAVSSRSDPLWGDRLVAFYEGSVSEPALEAWSRKHLPSGLRPREFRRIELLPRNRMGKLDRRALKGYTAAMPGVATQAEAKVAGSRG
ncbi:MAG: class I adenylate-forming enzyme family protein [Chromatiales bacterium]|jgi:O-succinylbenzoic acid--CoA ligase